MVGAKSQKTVSLLSSTFCSCACLPNLLITCRIPHVALTEPFEALHIDLQSRLSLAQSRDTSAEQPEVLWESMSSITIPLKHGGRWNGIAYWFEVSSDVRSWSVMSKCNDTG